MVPFIFFEASNRRVWLSPNYLKTNESLFWRCLDCLSIAISSFSSTPNIISNYLSPAAVILGNSSIHLSTSNTSSTLYRAVSTPAAHVLTDEIKTRTSKSIIEWLRHNKDRFSFLNTNFNQGSDFQVELNSNLNGIIVRCKYGTTSAIDKKKVFL